MASITESLKQFIQLHCVQPIHPNYAHNSPDITVLELDNKVTMGYTLRTLAASLWTYWHAGSFEEGLLTVVNEGGYADTNAAVACAILGAKFGAASIPFRYVDSLHETECYRAMVSDFIGRAINDSRLRQTGQKERETAP